jgi:hypothetical protein
MKTNTYIYTKITFLLGVLLLTTSCERELSEDAELATFSSNANVFIDGFSGGLEYYPYADSKQEAFSVDTEVKYLGSSSMRFDVPNVGDPNGAYAGAIFRDDNGGRDLSGYDALTFWAKATKAATINDIGFGQDFGANKFQVSKQGLVLTTNWVKYIIPIPDASKLTQEQGMLWYAEGPEDGAGYTFWIDELKYEKLGTIAQPRPAILNGANETQRTFKGGKITLTGLTQTFNLANGLNQTISVAPSYYDFIVSDLEGNKDNKVATVDEFGVVNVVGSGSKDPNTGIRTNNFAVVTANLNGVETSGSITLESLGDFTPAPTPTRDASAVISIFSDAYTNVAVDHFNGYWGGSTTQGQDDIEINGNKVINYTALNYVGTEFFINVSTINASAMTHFHIDIQVQETISASGFIAIKLQDIGPDNNFNTSGDNSAGELRFRRPVLKEGEWVSLDIPLSSFPGLRNRANLAQLVYVTDGTIKNILIDNIYFYK